MNNSEVKILIIDDDQDVLIELEHVLESEGYVTVTAWSGQEAIGLSDLGRFNLFLVDEHLIDVNSGPLAKKLRQLQPTVPLLLMCSRTNDTSMPSSSDYPAVCKWEHDTVMARVRGCLAA
jgi:DNA-binding response OmpR family regulator